MSVTTKHPEYLLALPLWKMVADSLLGEDAIKSKSVKYLPKTTGMVTAEKANKQLVNIYEAYLFRSEYPLWVADNIRASMGLVSRLSPEINVPKELESVLGDFTDDGFSVRQFFQRLVKETVEFGRAPMIIDADDDGKPFVSLRTALSAINWREESHRGRRDLTLSVFIEEQATDNDEYSHNTEDVYRVYHMVDGVCHVKLVKENGTTVTDSRPLGLVDNGGNVRKGLPFVPVIYCGATDNNPDVDEIPLMTMVRSALKYYQISADYFQSLHQTSHPQPWVAGIPNDQKYTITGPQAAWNLGEKGTCGYLEITGAGIEANLKAMTDQKRAAVESGARLYEAGGIESGESRKTRQAEQHASLHTIVITAAEATEQALKYMAEWLGLDQSKIDEIRFVVKPEFNIGEVDAQIARTLFDSVMAGQVSPDAYWQYLTLGKLPERDYEEEKLHIESNAGLGL